jgi:hypothetical protein
MGTWTVQKMNTYTLIQSMHKTKPPMSSPPEVKFLSFNLVNQKRRRDVCVRGHAET